MESQNGFSVPPAGPDHIWTIPGSDVPLSLLDNYVGFALVHFLTWYVDNIEPLLRGQTFGGINEARPPRGSTHGVTNHASYTAVDANSLLHMQGSHESHYQPGEVHAIEQRLYWMHRIAVGGQRVKPPGWDTNDNAGVVRWGRDYKRAPEDDMHYEWNRTPAGADAGWRLADHLVKTPRGQEVLHANPQSAFVRHHV